MPRHVRALAVRRAGVLARRLRARAAGSWHRLRGIAAWQWFRDHQRVTTLIGIASLGVAVVALVQQWNANPNGGAAESTVDSGTRSPLLLGTVPPWGWTTIVNTWSDEEGRYVGVTAARSPFEPGKAPGGYLESQRVRILCQVRDGRLVTDSVRGRTLSTTVWDATAEGFWIPDIYTDLPKTGPNRPPPCHIDRNPIHTD